MAADDLTKVFNLFEQGDSTISRTRGGLGIGLTLVKRIVEMHGGYVTAHSAGLEQGSEFVVRLPISNAIPSATRTSGRFGAETREQGRRILVVDDNVDAAMSIERLLKSWGHEVQSVFNGFEAVAKARTFKPQIVLLDIGMPGMSGYDVAKQLRAEGTLEGVIITALTGYGQSEDRRLSLEAGFNHHLIKPPNPTVLAALLKSPQTFSDRFESN